MLNSQAGLQRLRDEDEGSGGVRACACAACACPSTCTCAACAACALVVVRVLRVLRVLVRRHVLRSWFPPTPGNPGTPPVRVLVVRVRRT